MKLRKRIAEILGTGSPSAGARDFRGAWLSIHKSIACGSMMLLAVNPGRAGAAGLGELNLESKLGQPLEATVPLILGDGESLRQDCVQPAPASGSLRQPPELRVVSPAFAGPGAYEIRVTTAAPLREPMYDLSLMIHCPGASLLVRQYVLILDLPGMQTTEQPPEAGATSPGGVATPARSTRGVSDAGRPRQLEPDRTLRSRSEGIPSGSLYRVSRGDSLSTIARRVGGRPADTIWQVAERIFADNPEAFIRNDPDMIKLGSLIRVPDARMLAAMMPSRRGTLAAPPAARSTDTAAAPVSVDDAEQMQPRATDFRAEVEAPGRGALPVAAALPLPEPEPAAEAEPNSTPDAAATAPSYPFAAEPVTQAPSINTAGSSEGDTPSAGVTAGDSLGDEMADAGQPRSLLWLLTGFLLAGALTLLLLRNGLLRSLGAGRRSSSMGAYGAAVRQPGAFDESMAAEAFGIGGDAEAPDTIPVGAPMEDTYIVELSSAEPTMEEDRDTVRADAAEQDTTTAPHEARDAPSDDGDSAELARLFGAEDETGSAGPGDEGPTAVMPFRAAGEPLDPEAELLRQALDDIFDPTGGVDDPVGEVEPSLRDAFSEDVDSFARGRAMDGRAAATSESLQQAIADAETIESRLADLPSSDAEEDKLSATLREAVTVLERELEEELSASQILERPVLEHELQADLDRGETDRPKSRKNRNTG